MTKSNVLMIKNRNYTYIFKQNNTKNIFSWAKNEISWLKNWYLSALYTLWPVDDVTEGNTQEAPMGEKRRRKNVEF